MELRFSDDLIQVLEQSRCEAVRTGWHNISPDHIMLGILRHSGNPAIAALEACGVIPSHFKSSIDEAVFVSEQIPWEERDSVNLSDSSMSMLQHASLEAARCHDGTITPLHFLLAVCRISGTYSHDFLDSESISLRQLVEAAGIPWGNYGLGGNGGSEAAMTGTAAPDPQILAAAIEKRIREGYGTDNPHVS